MQVQQHKTNNPIAFYIRKRITVNGIRKRGKNVFVQFSFPQFTLFNIPMLYPGV